MNRTTASIGALVVMAAAITAGCTREQESLRSAAAATAYTARFETLVIPDGTSVVATLDTRLSTNTSRTGDRFVLTTVEPTIVNGRTALPAGARIHGALRDVEPSGRTPGGARMTLVYQGVVDSEGMTRPVNALPLALRAAPATQAEAGKFAAGSTPIPIIGGIAGGATGAVIGTGVDASAEIIVMLAPSGDEVALDAGQKLVVRMISPTRVQVMALH